MTRPDERSTIANRPTFSPSMRHAAAGLLLALTLAVAAVITSLATVRYRTLLSDWAFDLAFFHNLVFNAAHGDGFVQSASTHEFDGLFKLSHAFLLLPLTVPFYALVPRLETLLALQALALASGAFPVARLARGAGASTSLALLTAVLYLSSMPLWRLGLADFRCLTLAIPALLWLLAGLELRRTGMTAMAALAACLAREEIPLLVITTAGALWLFRRTDRRPALAAIGIATTSFLLLLLFHPRTGYYIPFHRPDTLLEAARLAPSQEMPRWLQLKHLASYLPAGQMPALLEPAVLLSTLPLIAYQLLISPYEWWHWTGAYIHHTGPLLAFTAGAAACGWGRLEARIRSRLPAGGALVGGLALAMVAVQAWGTSRQVSQAMGWLEGEEAIRERAVQVAALESLMRLIPADARVATDYRLIARLSGRRWLYVYQASFETPPPGQAPGLRLPGLKDVDWMLIDETHESWIGRMDHAPDWRLEGAGGGYRLYHRSLPAP